MGCDVRFIRFHSWIRWLVTVVIFPIFSIGFCDEVKAIQEIANDVLQEIDIPNLTLLNGSFDQLEINLSSKADPIIEAKNFLENFIFEINHRYKTNLTLPEICYFIKNHAEQLHIPLEVQAQLLQLMEQWAFKTPIVTSNRASWPWNWFGTSKKNSSKSKQKKKPILLPLVSISQDPQAMDAAAIVGVLEVIAGASVGIAFGETGIGTIVAGGLIADGIQRISNKGEKDLDGYLRDRRLPSQPSLDGN